MTFWSKLSPRRALEVLFDNTTTPTTPAAGQTIGYADSVLQPSTCSIDEYGAIARHGNIHNPNLVRNGGFWFAQRQPPATLTTYSSVGGRALTADGWGVSNENASVQYVRSDSGISPETNLLNRYYGNFTKITSTGKLVVCQVIESVDAEAVRGKRVRLQMKLKGIGNATWRIGLVQSTLGSIDAVPKSAGLFITAFGANTVDPTLGSNLAYIAPDALVKYSSGTAVGNGITCPLTGSWSLFSGVFPVPTGARNLTVMIWSDSQVAAAAGVAISEVSLTEGYEIQAWAPRAAPYELARCQRYYCKSFDIDTGPAQSVLAGAVRGAVSVAGATAGQPIGIRFPVAMRAAPTMTYFNPAAANAFARNTTANTDATATASANTTGVSTDTTFTGIAAWTVGQSVAVQYTADAEL